MTSAAGWGQTGARERMGDGRLLAQRHLLGSLAVKGRREKAGVN